MKKRDSIIKQISRQQKIFLNSDITLKMVSGLGDAQFYNESFLRKISEISTIYAEKITGFFGTGACEKS